MESLNEEAVKNLREYLQIPSVHPNVDYSDCVKFLHKIAESLNLPIQVIYVRPSKPVVIITWTGERPDIPSVLLNSHMDVVPAFEELWTHKPFAADIEDGKIFARGSQDMKTVGIQYLEAIRRLKLKGVICVRNVHVCFVPDEEIGGKDGMKLFVQTNEFKDLNVGVSLDESYANDTNEFIVFHGEKQCWQFTIRCKGQSGHGSLLLENSPGEKITYILNKFYEFRNAQKKLVPESENYVLSNVISINCTKISGGVLDNVVPCEMSVSFDCRIPSSNCLKEFEEMINRWCDEAGPDCSIEYHQKDQGAPDTALDNSNIFWGAFNEAAEELGIQLKVTICVGTTDSRYLRQVGIPAFGFTPLNNTPILLHSHDEFVRVDTFLKGIDIYCTIISKLANVEESRN